MCDVGSLIATERIFVNNISHNSRVNPVCDQATKIYVSSDDWKGTVLLTVLTNLTLMDCTCFVRRGLKTQNYTKIYEV